jgi:hypothetical protein
MKGEYRGNIAYPDQFQRTGRGGGGLDGSGGGNHTGGMEARIAVLEQIAKATAEALGDIKTDIRSIRNTDLPSIRDRHDTDFRLLFAALIVATIGLSALMAKGFHWIG